LVFGGLCAGSSLGCEGLIGDADKTDPKAPPMAAAAAL